MKKHIKYLVLSTMICFSSCDILDEDPASFISPENFYKTKGDAISAVTSCYAVNRTNGDTNRNYVILGDITTDDMFPLPNNNDRVQLDNYQHTSQNVILREAWQNYYRGITRCNVAITRIPPIPSVDEELKARLVGEAKFLRAFYYFNLVRLFGKVPVVLTEVNTLDDIVYPERSSVDDVYTQILKDFTDAEAVLPLSYTNADRGRATKGAAKAYLSLVYLTRHQYKLAADKAKEVMAAEFGYGLWADYKDVFDVNNEYGKESIWDAQFVSGPSGQGSNLIAFFAQENNKVAGRGFGSFQPTPELYAAFDPTDKRLPYFFTKGTDNKWYCNKWVDVDATAAYQSDNNYPYMRYAEVLLNFAEAANEDTGPTQEIYDAVNAIRTRAGLAPLENLTQDELREAILSERRLELCFEGHRWYDLVRTGRLVTTMTAAGKDKVRDFHNVFPVPQIEIDLNNKLNPQNDGY
ncbi:RagB/SusD family nutrient uptake outer membrane protein [Pseudochryseolinea flava]|uniref:RagB/SusD family nutrient uptake outer membrane protein n=1 Tax=Pseudochryseolinea flava TaxID=2059302 RepID=A0A364Y4B4_9BACT|nr:RagB/SusD family nutrient uptake outer membrane protein [Pseudochryseolinea flava]RAW00881.1 RagB/SusD family nutrient uptake outer membrane protein [Pseudochryseolinea flava]